MTTSIESCILPLNFKEFDRLNNITGNLEETLLLARLKFHQKNSKITKSGKVWIVRSREQISSWFNFDKKKTDRLLSHLEKSGLIEKKVGLWYGKKALFISVNKEINDSPVNHKILSVFIDVTNSIQNALVFAKILFTFNNSKIEHENKKWSSLTKQTLADWAKLSVRTIDKILYALVKNGLVLKKNFVWKEKLKSHFHIPNFVIESIKDQFEKLKALSDRIDGIKKTSPQICRQGTVNLGISIKLRENLQKATNKTYTPYLSTEEIKCDINFDSIGEELTERQTKYLEGALRKTVESKGVRISNPKEFFEQLKFSILNINLQHKGIESFKHAVSRCMKILSDNNWRTPKGFHNHSEYGINAKIEMDQKEKEWQKEKSSGIHNDLGGIIMKKISKGSELIDGITNKAMQTARYLKSLIEQVQKNSNDSNLISKIFNDFLDKIQGFIKEGADKHKILPYIEKNIICLL
jgi:hypothetical protein